MAGSGEEAAANFDEEDIHIRHPHLDGEGVENVQTLFGCSKCGRGGGRGSKNKESRRRLA